MASELVMYIIIAMSWQGIELKDHNIDSDRGYPTMVECTDRVDILNEAKPSSSDLTFFYVCFPIFKG